MNFVENKIRHTYSIADKGHHFFKLEGQITYVFRMFGLSKSGAPAP
jgi:hypothetical protein